jgi:dipeptidyl aminopeptidase/acylaminoacyl peptidase
MKRMRVAVVLAFVAVSLMFVPLAAQNSAKRALALDDVLAFRSLGQSVLSNDGNWLAYRVSPNQGDADVIVRSTSGDKEWKIPVGQGAMGQVLFSDDSAWIAIGTAPTKKEADTARRTRRTLQNGVTLINLATGDKTSIAKVRRFAFNGELGGWIALHRYGPENAPGAAAPAAAGRGGGPAPAPAAGAGGARDTRPRGTDLVLRELKTGAEQNIGNVSEFAFNKSGKFLALVIDAADQAGNGIQIRDLTTGAISPIESDKAFYERLSWAEEGDALAVLKGHDDRAWKERLYAVVGFTGFGAGAPKEAIYDPAKDSSFPKEMSISGSRTPEWTESRDGLLFGIATITKAEPPRRGAGETPGESAGEAAQTPPAGGAAAEDTSDRPDLVIWHYKDPRLQSMQEVQESRDRQFSYLSIYRVAENKFIRLADEEVRNVTPAPKHKWAIGNDVRAYELDSNLSGRSFRDVYAINMATGERKLLKKQTRWEYQPSPDGTKWYCYENRHFWVFDLATGASKNITANVPTSFVNVEDDHNVADPPAAPVGWTSDSASILLSDRWDVWKVSADASTPAVNLTVNGRKDSLRYRSRVRIDPEEKGIDLKKPQYFSVLGEWTKKQGYGVLDPGSPGVKMLIWDDAGFGRLAKAEKADVWIYTRETVMDPPEIYITNAKLENGRKVTNMHTEVEPFLWCNGSMLIEYKNAKGERLQGSLFLPANYEKGKQYPMIVYIYERLTQEHNNFNRPAVPGTGFNRAMYTSNGYAVLQPDIKYYLNDPGMSAVWAIVPAVKAAIATGVVDPKHVGLHGHSWGGYQTAFTVTQTDIFAAAAAGAPLTDMISMYSLIYKNTGGTNGAIFESSQGRFTSGPWDNWEAYTRNSPVAGAKNVKTPLMMLSNDKDGAVDFTQGIEYFDTLRRLGKPVVLLEYPGENHSLAKQPNMQDYMVRMKEFFDHYLTGAPAPEWLENGIPRLKMQDHVTDRLKQQQEAAKKKADEKKTTTDKGK